MIKCFVKTMYQKKESLMKNNGINKLSPTIVRNLFDTILNPLYDKILYVNQLLSEGNLTWEPFNHELIDIGPLASYYDFRYARNYEQLIQNEFNELLDLNVEYDQKRSELNAECSKLFKKLIESKELNSLFYDKINEYEKKGMLSESDAAYSRRIESIEWIAKYLVNNIKTLSESNIIHGLWNNESAMFFKILNSEEIRPMKHELNEKFSSFRDIASKTLTAVREKSDELSLKYGVPIVQLAI